MVQRSWIRDIISLGIVSVAMGKLGHGLNMHITAGYYLVDSAFGASMRVCRPLGRPQMFYDKLYRVSLQPNMAIDLQSELPPFCLLSGVILF